MILKFDCFFINIVILLRYKDAKDRQAGFDTEADTISFSGNI